jgi:tRNA (mo5U34)-methyltransferase
MNTPDADATPIRDRVDAINWFHRIDLGNGIVTPGADDTPAKLQSLQLPALAAKTVLDIGANDGFFSFAAERAGASRVLAVDAPGWGDAAWGSKAGFECAREVLASNVEDCHSDLYDLTPERVGTFDVVLMLGVLYHLEDPILALRRVAGLTKELLVLETLVDLTWSRRPAAAFYPKGELGGDDSNWWGPNPAAVIGMLAAAGFRDARHVGTRSLTSKLGHLAYNIANVTHSRLVKERSSLRWGYLQTDRAVFHAYR